MNHPLIDLMLPRAPIELAHIHSEICGSPHDLTLRKRFAEALYPHHLAWAKLIDSDLKILAHHQGELDLTDIEIFQLHRDKSQFLQPLIEAGQSSNPWSNDLTLALGAGFFEVASARASFWQHEGKSVREFYPVRFLSLSHLKTQGLRADKLHGITELLGINLSGNELTSEDLHRVLDAMPPLKHLIWLDLSHNHLTQEAITHLLTTDKLTQLQVLLIDHNPLENPIPELWIDQGYPIGHGESSLADTLCQIYGYKPWLYPSLNPESHYLHP